MYQFYFNLFLGITKSIFWTGGSKSDSSLAYSSLPVISSSVTCDTTYEAGMTGRKNITTVTIKLVG